MIRSLTLLAIVIASSPAATAQCLTWSDRFVAPGVDPITPPQLGGRAVAAMAVFDDGNGPALYVAGGFRSIGNLLVNSIAKWDGTQWSPLGSGIQVPHLGDTFHGQVHSLVVHDDGSGPALYVGGTFDLAGGMPARNIARWDGAEWSPVGGGIQPSPGVQPKVHALAVFDLGLGSGPELYAGGEFFVAGAANVNNVAKWNGSAWSELGIGVDRSVRAFAVFDDGNGRALYAGGDFFDAGGTAVRRIAKWNASGWSDVGGGVTDSGQVHALATFDDGGGPALYVGGSFATIGSTLAPRVAKWDGASYSALGSGISVAPVGYPVEVDHFVTFDPGTGPRLYAGGSFLEAGGAPARNIAAWDGASWSALDGGTDGYVHAGCVFDSDAGGPIAPRLFLGGDFRGAGDAGASGIAVWDGADFSGLAVGEGVGNSILAFATFDDGSGPALYAGGRFEYAGSTAASGVAKWNGTTWVPLGGGITLTNQLPLVSALTVFDDGTGPALYATGRFTAAGGLPAENVARWNGSSWSSVGAGLPSQSVFGVNALAVFDDGSGPALYAGGFFTSTEKIMKWDGASWTPLASHPDGTVQSLAVYDDGTGRALYAGGTFSTAGGVNARGIARWNGAAWSDVGGGLTNEPPHSQPQVPALAVFRDPMTGNAELFAGGLFASAGGVSVSSLARWNGTTWSAAGGSFDITTGGPTTFIPVYALKVFDDGTGKGEALYAGGEFDAIAGVEGFRALARWNGASWSPVGGGVTRAYNTPGVRAMAVFDDGAGGGADLYVGGSFTDVGGAPTANVAQWHGCGELGLAYCFGDGSLGVPCPCVPPNTVPNPSGAAGHGCANSFDLDGAKLQASGTTAPDTVRFTCAIGPNYLGFGFLVKGNAQNASGIASHDGVRCVDGALIRFGAHNAGTGGAAPGYWTYPNTAQTLSVSAATAQAPGQNAEYQLFYRNAEANFCTTATANWSNGVRVSWN